MDALLEPLVALADRVQPRAATATGYLTDVLLSPTSDSRDPLVADVTALLSRVRPELSIEVADETARLLIGLTVREALNHPARPPQQNAARAHPQVLGTS